MVDTQNFIYRDEPILIDFTQKDIYIPPEYMAMRKIAKSGGAVYKSADQIFYEQGKFMEDFEDDFDYRGNFMRYYPTYQSMSDAQLRGYFSWRTKVRRGEVERTALSFVFVYIYELINRIGAPTPEEGFYALKNFWAAYREFDAHIDRYIAIWLKDYVVYYNLDKSLLGGFTDANFNNALLTLFSSKDRSADEIFSALNSLSSYDMENSRFFKRHSEDVKNVVREVFEALSEYYGENGKKNFLFEKFFGQFYSGSYYMFRSAVFYRRPREDFVYNVNKLCRYTLKNGNWIFERFLCYKSKNRQIGALLKNIDFVMRRKFNFKSSLKAEASGQISLGVIEKIVDDYFENKLRAAQPKIEIDVSKLQNIRDTALETQNKLLIEEEIEETRGALPRTPLKEHSPLRIPFDLDDDEYGFLKCLLYGGKYDDVGRLKGVPLSVLVDAVNEKLFDRFGDTVIIDAGERAEVIADYTEELKGIIGE